MYAYTPGCLVPFTEFFYYYYFSILFICLFMKLTIQYPFKYTFIQTKPLFRKNLLTLKLHNFKTVEAMTAKIANRPIPSCLF